MGLALPGTYEGYAFSLGAVTGTVGAGAAAGSEIFQFRWKPSDTGVRARILAVQLSAANAATAFAAGNAAFDLTLARGWSVAGTGGSVVTPSGNSNKLRVSQNASRIGGEIRVASTAALGAGTKTLDDQPIGAVVAGVPAVAGTAILYPETVIYADSTSYGVPLVLASQEGFVIRATVPATGTWKAAVRVLWVEVD